MIDITKPYKIIVYYNKTYLSKKWLAKISGYIVVNYKEITVIPVYISQKRDLPESADFVLVLGGDGTILSAAKRLAYLKIPVFGLNLGKFGFLAAERRINKFFKAIDELLNGRFNIEERLMLKALIFRQKDIIYRGIALNDILIRSVTNIISFALSVNQQIIKEVAGDGILIATPTGSTAHSLSAGGPIVMPGAQCFLINFLAPFSLPIPTVITDSTSFIEIKVKSFKGRANASVDGGPSIVLKRGDLISIYKSKQTARLAFLSENQFFDSLREKFRF